MRNRVDFRASALLLVAMACLAVPGRAERRSQTVLGQGKAWETPVYVNDSGVDGPTVLVTGGVHGNEPAGAAAANQIRHWPIVRGKLIVIPQVNRLALANDSRYIPKAVTDERDLNRNFPSPAIADEARGEIAHELWDFVLDQDPDWLFDLHEGYQFNISHKPKPGKEKSVGSTIIYDRSQKRDSMVERMLVHVNGLVTEPERKFLLRGRGPKKTTLASAVINVLGKPAMILETTYQYQRLPVRTRQHRTMMSVALREIGMMDRDLAEVVTPSGGSRAGKICVALFDDEGGSENGVNTLSSLLRAEPGLLLTHMDAADAHPDFLKQFDVVVFGGGSGSAQAKSLGDDGKEAVRAFIADGGGCIGICGGAYLCSAFYTWSLKVVDTHVFTGVREIEGVGRKAMYLRGPNAMVDMQLTSEGRHVFKGIDEHSKVSFHNGPIVSPMNLSGLPPYTPLAYFRSERALYPPQEGTMIHSPAIVMGQYGKGSVISISPHPERSPGLESMISRSVDRVAKSRRALATPSSLSPAVMTLD